jgi:small subunit ribosomal protein S6
MHPRRYETLILLSPNLSPVQKETFKVKVEQILESGGAKVLRFEDWGRRALAYPVHKELHGQYMLYDYQGEPKVEAELKRNLKIDEFVFKHLTLILDTKFTDEKFEAEKEKLLAAATKKETPEGSKQYSYNSQEPPVPPALSDEPQSYDLGDEPPTYSLSDSEDSEDDDEDMGDSADTIQ